MSDFIEAAKNVALAVYALESSNVPSAKYLTSGSHEDLPEEVQNVVSIANTNLITRGGHPRFTVMGILQKEYGITVTRGESDLFGWLTGVIVTRKGRVAYG